MMKKRLIVVVLSVVLIIAFSLQAEAFNIPASETGRELWQAPENSAVIKEDGALDLIRVNFIHYAKTKNDVKPPQPLKPSKTELGYELMKVKWLTQESFSINYNRIPESLTKAQVKNIIIDSVQTWDNETTCSKTTQADLFNYNAVGSTEQNYGTYDYVNTIAFGDYNQSNVIAVTSVWYNRATRVISEFDMLFNTAYAWSSSGINQAMDLQNIATHEFGHAIGMADIYNDLYNYVTMYGYADYGETDKRSLDKWDIRGLTAIYGV